MSEPRKAQNTLIEIISLLEQAKILLEAAKTQLEDFDGRAISIAITNLETSQLWVANAER